MRTAVLLFALALLARMPAQQSSTAQEHADKALQLARQGNLKGAENEMRRAVELAPQDPAQLTSLGAILGMEGDLQQANIYLTKAVQLKPDEPASRRNLAANQWQLGRLKDAHENLERLLAANSQDKIAVFLLGMVSEREKNYTRSIALLESIPEAAGRQPEILVALASSYYHVNRAPDARSSLQRLASISAKPEVVFMGGRVAIDARDYALAERMFSAARANYPDTAAIESQIAFAQYRQGHALESEQTLTAAMAAGYAGQDAYLLLCNVLVDQNQYERALKIATEAVQRYPDSYEALSTKGAIESKLQYFTAAVASLESAARMHPSAETSRELALAEWRSGDRPKAIAGFEQTLRQSPRDAQTCVLYGTLLLDDSSPEAKVRAVELFRQALAQDDSLVEPRYQLAKIELAEGKLQPALQHLTEAIQRNANDSRLHFTLNRIYRRLGRTSDADREMEAYEKLKAAPGQPQDEAALGAPR